MLSSGTALAASLAAKPVQALQLDLAGLNGANGFRINGIVAFDYSGRSISGAGDVNEDGFADLLISAYRASPNGNSSGQS